MHPPCNSWARQVRLQLWLCSQGVPAALTSHRLPPFLLLRTLAGSQGFLGLAGPPRRALHHPLQTDRCRGCPGLGHQLLDAVDGPLLVHATGAVNVGRLDAAGEHAWERLSGRGAGNDKACAAAPVALRAPRLWASLSRCTPTTARCVS